MTDDIKKWADEALFDIGSEAIRRCENAKSNRLLELTNKYDADVMSTNNEYNSLRADLESKFSFSGKVHQHATQVGTVNETPAESNEGVMSHSVSSTPVEEQMLPPPLTDDGPYTKIDELISIIVKTMNKPCDDATKHVMKLIEKIGIDATSSKIRMYAAEKKKQQELVDESNNEANKKQSSPTETDSRATSNASDAIARAIAAAKAKKAV
jgi:hypothetical protein